MVEMNVHWTFDTFARARRVTEVTSGLIGSFIDNSAAATIQACTFVGETVREAVTFATLPTFRV